MTKYAALGYLAAWVVASTLVLIVLAYLTGR
jgi:hypothetical protein